MSANGSKTLNYITVFITGMAVMFLEILGTRIIGPFYGVNLFVWSALISVALVSLAVGYYLGGLVADKKETFLSVYLILGIAASSIAIIPVVDTHVLLVTNSLGIRLGVLISAFLLFAIPLTSLGMIGPYMIKLNSEKLENVGITSGSIFAISTVGSFLGTLLIGFLLIPNIGTRNIIYILSAVLFLLSLALLMRERLAVRQSVTGPLITVFIIFFLVIAGSFGFTKIRHLNITDNFDVIYESESLYGKVKVINDLQWNVRWLMADSSTIGGKFLKTNLPVFSFLYFLESVPLLNPSGKKALLIGLGAGSLPKALLKKDIITDVIEIDPKVAFAAQEYFDFTPPGKFTIGDARFHIKKLEGKYDFIFHDTFTGGSVPSHLLSKEVIQDLKSLLNEKGILALVYFGFFNKEQAIASCSVYKTLSSEFPYVKIYVSKEDTDPVDLIFISSMIPIEPQHVVSEGQRAFTAGGAVKPVKDLEIELPKDKGLVITDNYNPLESLQLQKAEAYRDNVIELIGRKMLLH